jgi:hypothetical protein
MTLRLVNAEFLKLRRRRGLLAFALGLTVGAVLVQYVTLAILRANNPVRFRPAGGVDNLYTTLSVLVTFAPVAGVLIGAAAGAGDLEAGLFRELASPTRAGTLVRRPAAPSGSGDR